MNESVADRTIVGLPATPPDRGRNSGFSWSDHCGHPHFGVGEWGFASDVKGGAESEWGERTWNVERRESLASKSPSETHPAGGWEFRKTVAELGFCIIGPPVGEGALQFEMRNSDDQLASTGCKRGLLGHLADDFDRVARFVPDRQLPLNRPFNP